MEKLAVECIAVGGGGMANCSESTPGTLLHLIRMMYQALLEICNMMVSPRLSSSGLTYRSLHV